MFPNIEIEISSNLTSEAINLLSKGKLDMVIFKIANHDLPSNIEVIEAKEEKLCFYASKKYLEEHNINSYEDLKNCNIIFTGKKSNTLKEVNEFLKQNDIDLSAKYMISSSEARKYFALNNMGVTVGQESLIRNELNDGSLIKLDLKPSLPKIKAGIAIQKRNISSFATLKLIDFIKDQFEE